VVPTLGKRLNYLIQALMSIREAGDSFLCVVSPQPDELQTKIDSKLYDRILPDPGRGLSAAIDFGIRALPDFVKYVNWLGDDDLLVAGSITLALSVIESDEDISLVFGRCQYIDEQSNHLWLNKSGRWTTTLMRVGPQLVPQPGALISRGRYEEVGGLNHDLKWAFDLDLFLKLSRVGATAFIPATLAKFRWHDDSLSVGGRAGSVAEASAVRVAALPSQLRAVSVVWEKPLQMLIRHSGRILPYL